MQLKQVAQLSQRDRATL